MLNNKVGPQDMDSPHRVVSTHEKKDASNTSSKDRKQKTEVAKNGADVNNHTTNKTRSTEGEEKRRKKKNSDVTVSDVDSTSGVVSSRGIDTDVTASVQARAVSSYPPVENKDHDTYVALHCIHNLNNINNNIR